MRGRGEVAHQGGQRRPGARRSWSTAGSSRSTSPAKRLTDGFGDMVLQRCISYYRSAFLTRILENFGLHVINTSKVSEVCGNKLDHLDGPGKGGRPDPEDIRRALLRVGRSRRPRQLGYPVVMKPFVGSWGRMVSIAKEPQTLGTIVELRESIQSPVEHMYYLQEFVKRPPRDIRLIVAGEEIIATVYRNAPAERVEDQRRAGCDDHGLQGRQGPLGDRAQGGPRRRRRHTRAST